MMHLKCSSKMANLLYLSKARHSYSVPITFKLFCALLFRITGVLSLIWWHHRPTLHCSTYYKTDPSFPYSQRKYNLSTINIKRNSDSFDIATESPQTQSLLTCRNLWQSIVSVACISIVCLTMSIASCAHELIQDPVTLVHSKNTYHNTFLNAQAVYLKDSSNIQADPVKPSNVMDWDQIKLSPPTDEHPRIRMDPSQNINTGMRIKSSKDNIPLVQGTFYNEDGYKQ